MPNMWFRKKETMEATSCNTSEPLIPSTAGSELFSTYDNIAIIVGKMIIQPMIGCSTAVLLRGILSIPDDVDASFYLVVMIVFCCPTANTMVVMCELGGVNKEAVSRSIFFQYLTAPFFLSLSVGACVKIAAEW
jgi:predicted permease